MPFDIVSLRAFAPAEYQCEKCRALLIDGVSSLGLRYDLPMEKQSPVCPICHMAYLPTNDFQWWNEYINRNGRACLSTKEALVQAQQLAEIAERMRFFQQCNDKWALYTSTPLHGLLKALSVAQKFVHFTTYGGIPHLLIGTLKVTAQRVPVRGVVSGAPREVLSENTVSELTHYPEEAPDMHIKIYDPSLTGWKSMPHQKLIVIDGLLAFKGSANLTLSGWRKAAEGRDTVEVITDIEQVIELNNRLFAPVWAELSMIGETILMGYSYSVRTS